MSNEFILIICMLAMLVCGVVAAMSRSMIKSAISLAAVSVVLSIFMFVIGATWAAVFELSVCSGLVTVVFISAISLTESKQDATTQRALHLSRFAMLPLLLILVGASIVAVILMNGFEIVSTADIAEAEQSFRNVFWNLRQADILGQIFVVLVGTFAVVILFKDGTERKKERGK
ncbi:MAG: hypothetical protein Q4B50_04170 [Bacillota bacterium]|nr:hypothetical protein [Bacillota bacterium]